MKMKKKSIGIAQLIFGTIILAAAAVILIISIKELNRFNERISDHAQESKLYNEMLDRNNMSEDMQFIARNFQAQSFREVINHLTTRIMLLFSYFITALLISIMLILGGLANISNENK